MSFKILQRGTVALFILTLAAFIALKVYTILSVDTTPPVITFAQDVLDVGIGAKTDDLLAGVTATDDRDGDVTGEVMVKGVSHLITANTAQITYIAFDSSNNMSTATRTLRYTNYEKPRFTLTRPLMFSIGSQVSILEHLTAQDVVDGDLSNSVRVTTQNVDDTRSGVYSVTVQVTNSLGDVEILPLKLTMTDSARVTPAVELSSYIVYLPVGRTFSPAGYILSPTDPSTVTVEGRVDTTHPGVYELSYTCQGDTVYQTVVVR